MLTKSLRFQRGHNNHLNMCWPDPSYDSEDWKCIPTCVNQTPPCHVRYKIPAWTKILLNIWRPNRFHAREDTKSISTCVDQTPTIPAKKQNVSQNELTKPLECQRGLNMYLNKGWTNNSHASEDTKSNSTCVDQIPNSHASEVTKFASACVDLTAPITAKTQKESQLVLMKHIPWVRGHKIYL